MNNVRQNFQLLFKSEKYNLKHFCKKYYDSEFVESGREISILCISLCQIVVSGRRVFTWRARFPRPVTGSCISMVNAAGVFPRPQS